MTDEVSGLDELVETLRRERDELRVQLQLAKQELRDQWDPIEGKWESLEGKLRDVGEAAGEAGKDVAAAASLLVDEITDCYKQIREEVRK